MSNGLEEVVEFILPEIALGGQEGVSVSEFLVLVKDYFHRGDATAVSSQDGDSSGPNPQPPKTASQVSLSDAEASLARSAWRWLVSRPEVLVGGGRQRNGLELDEILSLPEPGPEPEPEPTGPDEARTSQPVPPARRRRESKPKPEPTLPLLVQPRIRVTEETVWKRLTGHGVDYKRIPNLEWQCLVGIASAKREGILQGDLRRLVQQDKRSVPKRTDFLTAKGYVVKRSLFAHGTKTSKLWLASLAPPLFPATRGTARAADIDMSRAALTRDTSPVPWHSNWTGKDIDIESFTESLLAIVKAWGVMKYSDLRLKMGVEDLRWQMRAMSRLCRKLVDMGILRYAAATFLNSRKIWKDCIKFIRDPSEDEWAAILATGQKTSSKPVAARPQQPRRTTAPATDGQAASIIKPEDEHEEAATAPAPKPAAPVGWTPEKPLVHTMFDVIRAAGTAGTSTPQVSTSTVGYGFRRYIGTALSSMASIRQPQHLERYQISSELVRRGKTSTYMYSAKNALLLSDGYRDGGEGTIAASTPAGRGGEGDDPIASQPGSRRELHPYGFRAVTADSFAAGSGGSSPLSTLSRAVKKKGRRVRRDKRPRPPAAASTAAAEPAHMGEATTGSLAPEIPTDGDVERPSKRRRVEADDAGGLEEPARVSTPADKPDPPTLGEQPVAATEKLPGKPPGVYMGEPGSLNPGQRRQGRPKKSVVVIFKSEKLKSPGFLPQQEEAESSQYPPPNSSAKGEEQQQPPQATGGRGRSAKKRGATAPGGTTTSFRCDTCGGIWKNDVGLKYHLTKAQTPCNPNYTPQPPPTESPKKKRRRTVLPQMGMGPPKRPSGPQDRASARLRETTPPHQTPITARRRRRLLRAVQLVQNTPPTFRGLSADADATQHATTIAAATTTTTSTTTMKPRQEPPPVSPGPSSSRPTPPRPSGDMVIEVRDMMEIPDGADPYTFKSQHPTHGQIAATAPPAHQPREEPSTQPATTGPSLGAAGPSTPPPRSRESTEGCRDEARAIPRATPRVGRTQTTAATGRPPSTADRDRAADDASREPQRRRPSGGSSRAIKPFVPSGNYRRIPTESKLKSVRALEIIEYLLDNSGGAFPGDKALFYAVVRVFLEAFKGQSPPTFKNCRVALGTLDSKKKAREMVHAFRDTKGRLAAVYMVIRADLDPSGPVPMALKRKMQAAHPGLFIPAPFSPSEEELKILQGFGGEPPESDKDGGGGNNRGNKNSNRFRGRRETREVEVLNAPYYSQSPSSMAARRWRYGGNRDSVEDAFERADSESPTKRALRRETYDADAPERDGTVSKRRRTDSNGLGGEHADVNHVKPELADPGRLASTTGYDDNGAEPAAAVEASRKDARGDGGARGSPSVVDAIRTYGLLPSRWGARRDKTGSTAGWRSRLARPDNPGLDSLPAGFFKNTAAHADSQRRAQRAAPGVWFLEPNSHSHLEASEMSGSEDEDIPMSHVLEGAAAEAPVDTLSAEGGGKITFVPSLALRRDSEDGEWPRLPRWYFVEEVGNRSLHVEGSILDHRLVLDQNMPASVEDLIAGSKGKPGRRPTWVDPLLGDFCETVDRIRNWELSEEGIAVLSLGSTAPDHYNYINLSAPASRCRMRPVAGPTWSARNAFSLETLPYCDLDDEDESDVNNTPPPARKSKGRPRKNPDTAQVLYSFKNAGKGSNNGGGRSGNSHYNSADTLQVVALNTYREHTAYPRSADDFIVNRHGDDTNNNNDTKDTTATTTSAAATSATTRDDWYNDHTRIAAFVCITTLTGGVGRSVDWGLMLRLFPETPLSAMRRFWMAARRDKASTVDSLTDKFRKEFLRAYENDEVPAIDFDNLAAYDWKSLVLRTRKLLVTDTGAADLPVSLQELEKRDLVAADPRHKPHDWRETYFHPTRSYFDRFQDASSQAVAIPIGRAPPDGDSLDGGGNLTVAMSWIRALCLTPVAKYPAQTIKEKLKRLCGLSAAESSKLIEEASLRLQDQSMISKSSRRPGSGVGGIGGGSSSGNGRPWRIHDRVVKVLDKAAQQDKFARAAVFKRELDEEFKRDGEAQVRYVCNDGAVMAMLNLQAHRRIDVETTGQPAVPLGYEPFNYETRKYPKRYHHFRMHMRPTAAYLYDSDAPLADLRARLRAATPPRAGLRGEIPLWCDLLGQPDAARWRRCLGAVLFALSARGPMGADQLAHALRPALMPFEARLVLDWGEALGLLRPKSPAAASAPGEWWWLAVDTQGEVGGDEGPLS